MKIVMLFLDGVGIGARDPSVNPLFAAPMKTLRSLLDGELPSLRNRICVAAQGKPRFSPARTARRSPGAISALTPIPL